MKMLVPFQTALVLVVASIAQAADPTPLTLRNCIDAALRQSPLVKVARYDVDAARFNIDEQQAALYPYLGGQLNLYEVEGRAVSPFALFNVVVPENGASTKRRVNFGTGGIQTVYINYPLFQNGSIMGLNNAPSVAEAKALEKLQELTEDVSRQEVVLEVATAFFNVTWYREAIEQDRIRLTYSEERVRIAKREVGLGLKPAAEIDLAQAQVAADQATLGLYRESAHETLAQLAMLIGYSPEQQLDIDTSNLPSPSLPPLTTFLDGVLAKHPALASQRQNIDVAEQKYLMERSTMLPKVNLQTAFNAGQDLDRVSGANGNPLSFISVLTVDAPLFDWHQRLSATRQSQAKLQSERARLSAIEVSLRTAISAIFGEVHGIERNIAILERDTTQAEIGVRLARERRGLGLSEQLALINAEYAEVVAREALGGQRLARQIEFAKLQSAAGGLWNWLQ